MLREEGLKKKFSSYCTSIKLLEEGSKKKRRSYYIGARRALHSFRSAGAVADGGRYRAEKKN